LKRQAASTGLPWRLASGRPGAACVIVRFRLTPKSSKDAIDGLDVTAEGPAFKARVRALPEESAANAALELLVSEWLQVPKSAARLVAGAKSRVKAIAVGGDVNEIEDRLRAKHSALEPAKNK
jgi:uncharacterized protein